MIYIIDNGGLYSDHAVVFLDVPPEYDRPDVLDEILRLVSSHDDKAEIMASAEAFEWREPHSAQTLRGLVESVYCLGCDGSEWPAIMRIRAEMGLGTQSHYMHCSEWPNTDEGKQYNEMMRRRAEDQRKSLRKRSAPFVAIVDELNGKCAIRRCDNDAVHVSIGNPQPSVTASRWRPRQCTPKYVRLRTDRAHTSAASLSLSRYTGRVPSAYAPSQAHSAVTRCMPDAHASRASRRNESPSLTLTRITAPRHVIARQRQHGTHAFLKFTAYASAVIEQAPHNLGRQRDGFLRFVWLHSGSQPGVPRAATTEAPPSIARVATSAPCTAAMVAVVTSPSGLR